jgi:uncharacterized protein YjbI with pentapeptide repeats
VFNSARAPAARFDGADLRQALFGYANLDGAVFSGATFKRTDFHCASLDGSLSDGASGGTLGTDQPRAIAELYDPRRVPHGADGRL